MKKRILVVEDDPHILLGLREVLGSEGYEVVTCERGDQAIAAVHKETPDLLLLDVMLPGTNGFEICKSLRSAGVTIPILMLTAKSQEIDKVVGLELGADDYLTKPFGVRELLARIKALFRRTSEPGRSSASEVFHIGQCCINPRTLQVQRGRHVEQLSAKEMKLLKFFHARAGEVLSRDELLNEVWGYHYHGTTRTLDQTIAQLRKKIGDDGHPPKHLLTVHGIGYRLAS